MAQQGRDLSFRARHGIGDGDLDVNVVDRPAAGLVLAAEHPRLRRLQRNHHEVVLVAAAGTLALGLEHAYDRVRCGADADLLARRCRPAG